MKAFEMKLDGETEYVCAMTEKEALDYYLSAWVDESDRLNVVCREIPDNELGDLTITYYSHDVEDFPSETFREYLERATIVDKFCSTWDY